MTDSLDLFDVFWLGGVLVMIGVSGIRAVREIAGGEASSTIWDGGDVISRDEDPRKYWLAVLQKLLAFPLGAFVIWHASGTIFR